MRLSNPTNTAFSLVELTLALGVAAFCLLAVFGLMPVGVQTNRNATSQTAAAGIMAAVVADLRGTSKAYDNSKTYNVGDTVLLSGNCYTAIAITTGHQPPNSTYWTNGSPCPQFGIIFGTDRCVGCSQPPLYFDSTGRFTTSLDANSRYQLSVTWSVANATGACSASVPCADLKVTWPAAATPANASGTAETFAAFNRN